MYYVCSGCSLESTTSVSSQQQRSSRLAMIGLFRDCCTVIYIFAGPYGTWPAALRKYYNYYLNQQSLNSDRTLLVPVALSIIYNRWLERRSYDQKDEQMNTKYIRKKVDTLFTFRTFYSTPSSFY